MSRHATRPPGEKDQSPFAANLNAALAHTTSEAFARSIDRPLRTVQRWRSGETEPKGAALVAVAQALGLTVEDLYTAPPADREAA